MAYIPDHLRDAIELCKKAGIPFRYHYTGSMHLLFYVGKKSIVGMSGVNHRKDGDRQIYYSVLRDVKRAIKFEKEI